MRDDARAKAAIEILDDFLKGKNLNNTLEAWNKHNKFAGSTDREKIRDIVFDILRLRNTLKYPFELENIYESGRSLIFSYILYTSKKIDEIFTGNKYGPSRLDIQEENILEKFIMNKGKFFIIKNNVPDFLIEDLKLSLAEKFESIMGVLGKRSPISIRANFNKTDLFYVKETLKNEGIDSELSLNSVQGLRILNNFRRVKMSQSFQEGLFEFQDLNSQKVIEECDFHNYKKFLDFCSGAGGKILCLASLQKGRGSFFAYDKDKIKLEKLRIRAKRAGVDVEIIEKKEIDKHYKFFDCIVLDVPCSGSGAWSRNPQQKWRITPKLIEELIILQSNLLQQAKNLLKDNGKLIYITCSLLRTENQSIIENFILNNPRFSIARQKNYYPSEIGDGFYCAELLKNK